MARPRIYKHSGKEWFIIWQEIIMKEVEITRTDLAEKSGASIWTIKALQRDFILWDKYIKYFKGKFRLSDTQIENHYSTLSLEDRQEMK